MRSLLSRLPSGVQGVLGGCGRVWGVALLLLFAMIQPALAQRGSSPQTRLGVDLLSLKNGPRLRGVVVQRDKDGNVLMAVGRERLEATFPEFYRQQVHVEARSRREAYVELRSRITDWLAARPEAEDLQFFLRKELQRVEGILVQPADQPPGADFEFLLVEIAVGQIGSLVIQPPARKQIALLAWRERLPDVERRPVTELARALQEQGVDAAAEAGPIDLSSRLPPRPQSEREWAARRAIVEYQFVRSLDFQGTGDVLLPANAAEQLDLEQMLPQLQRQLAGELGRLLGEPLVEKPAGPTWFETATQAADKAGVLGVRVTRVDQNLAARRVAVETRFLARMPGGRWETVWSHTETADAARARPALEQQIAEDPQVRRARAVFETLGGGDENQVAIAIRFGAAVMEAQQTAESRFFAFRDRMLRRLDGPPILPLQ
jgi:hypothetical protein